MYRPFAGIKYFLFKTQWCMFSFSSKWFWRRHLPSVVRYVFESFYLPQYKTRFFTRQVWDGLTGNDFIKGRLIEFLYKLDAIRAYNYADDPDGRGYWIGNLDD